MNDISSLTCSKFCFAPSRVILFYPVTIPRLHVIKTTATLVLSAVRKMTEPTKKRQRSVFSIIKRVFNPNEQPPSANSTPSL